MLPQGRSQYNAVRVAASQKFRNRISVWLISHGPLRRHKPNKQMYLGPGTVDSLGTLDRNVFEETLIHLDNTLASICILVQENQDPLTAPEDFLDFEDAVKEIHGNMMAFTCSKW